MMFSSEYMYNIIDLDKYPVDKLDSQAGIELVERCRTSLYESSVCQLDGFLKHNAIDKVLEATSILIDYAWVSDQSHNVYFLPVPSLEATSNDPLTILQHSNKHAIAYDLIPKDLPLRVLYESDMFTKFVAAVLNRDALFPSADPLDALEIAVFTPGQELGWHFDNSEFSVTLMLQPAEAGGQFEYIPNFRTHDDLNLSGVAAFLSTYRTLPDSSNTKIHSDSTSASNNSIIQPKQLSPEAGTLSLFQGHLALHRVAPVKGTRNRINAVLTYGDQPGMQLSDLTRQLFYGRLA